MSGVEWFFAIDDSIALDEYINKKKIITMGGH